MKNDKKSQEFLKGKMEALKKIKKELEGASKMHKGQAERIGKML
tara:strand:+ start:1244 stop:1375 length:132 start_codon:yes stop_codon:yes gene_type:complete